MPIDQKIVDQILAKCGRRCAICRRFRPTKLQIHHIVERSQGGSDEPDNLIPICISCHTDVHSTVPFSQRFSINELKLHRDNLFELVANGKISEEVQPAPSRTVPSSSQMRRAIDDEYSLDETAVSILLAVTQSKSGSLFMIETNAGLIMKTDTTVVLEGLQEPRTVAKFRHALNQLIDAGLLELRSSSVAEATYRGFVLADDIESSASTPDEKAKDD